MQQKNMNSKRFWVHYRKKHQLTDHDQIDLPPDFGPDSYIDDLEEFHTDEEADVDENSNFDYKKHYKGMFSDSIGTFQQTLDREIDALNHCKDLMRENTTKQNINDIIQKRREAIQNGYSFEAPSFVSKFLELAEEERRSDIHIN